jgi:hypothetical protein
MITGIFLGVKGGVPAHKADNLTTTCWLIASVSDNPLGLRGLLQGQLPSVEVLL